MPNYFVLVVNNDPVPSDIIEINGTLDEAKAKAKERFGELLLDDVILIQEERDDGKVVTVSAFGASSKNWRDFRV